MVNILYIFYEKETVIIMNKVLEKISLMGIVPVVKINDAKDAAPLAKAQIGRAHV